MRIVPAGIMTCSAIRNSLTHLPNYFLNRPPRLNTLQGTQRDLCKGESWEIINPKGWITFQLIIKLERKEAIPCKKLFVSVLYKRECGSFEIDSKEIELKSPVRRFGPFEIDSKENLDRLKSTLRRVLNRLKSTVTRIWTVWKRQQTDCYCFCLLICLIS